LHALKFSCKTGSSKSRCIWILGNPPKLLFLQINVVATEKRKKHILTFSWAAAHFQDRDYFSKNRRFALHFEFFSAQIGLDKEKNKSWSFGKDDQQNNLRKLANSTHSQP